MINKYGPYVVQVILIRQYFSISKHENKNWNINSILLSGCFLCSVVKLMEAFFPLKEMFFCRAHAGNLELVLFTTSLTKMRRVSVGQSRGNSGALCRCRGKHSEQQVSLWSLGSLPADRQETRRSALRPPWHFACGRPAWSRLFTLCCVNNGSVPSLAFALSYTKNAFCHGRAGSPLCVISRRDLLWNGGGGPRRVSSVQTVTGSGPAGCRATLLAIARRPRRRAGSWLSHSAMQVTQSRDSRSSRLGLCVLAAWGSLPDSWPSHQTAHVKSEKKFNVLNLLWGKSQTNLYIFD